MVIYVCDVHRLRLEIDDQQKTRTIKWQMPEPMPRCELLHRDPVPIGPVGECQIRLLQEG